MILYDFWLNLLAEILNYKQISDRKTIEKKSIHNCNRWIRKIFNRPTLVCFRYYLPSSSHGKCLRLIYQSLWAKQARVVFDLVNGSGFW